VEGEASTLGRDLAQRLLALPPGRALVAGGEPTVTVGDQPGLGGPSQELALAAATVLDEARGCRLVAFSTDGRDGPTDAAGASVDGSTAAAARGAGHDPLESLRRHDAHAALDAAGALIRVPPTMTNLNHVFAAVREA
jgi:glycerate 2-kinase